MKRGSSLWTKGFSLWIGLVFVLGNQNDYGKTNKSLCLSMHSKFGNLAQMQVGYGKCFLKYVQKITASKICLKSWIEA